MTNKEALKELEDAYEFLSQTTGFVVAKREGIIRYLEALSMAVHWGKNEQRRLELIRDEFPE